MQQKMRILCAREYQTTIAESVHQLLREQIVEMGFGDKFKVQETSITCLTTGSEFLFIGLRRNVNNIRSIQNIKRTWIEEAQTLSKASWEVMLPSVMREEGAELWLTWNPELDTDETYQRIVVHGQDDPDVLDVEMNYKDNPWFPAGLEKLRLKDLARDPDAYVTIWEGKTRATLSGAVFGKEMRKVLSEGRRCRVRAQPGVPVDIYADLGKRDLTSMWFAQRYSLQTRVVGFYQNRGEDWPHYMEKVRKLFDEHDWIVGNLWLPHDGFAERLGMNKTIAAQARDARFEVRQVPSVPVETGISLARTAMQEAYFDEAETADGWNTMARYRFKVDDNGQWSSTPFHDDASNAGDAWRYLAIALKEPKKDVVRKPPPRLRQAAGAGWMGN